MKLPPKPPKDFSLKPAITLEAAQQNPKLAAALVPSTGETLVCPACGNRLPEARFPYRPFDMRCVFCKAKETDEALVKSYTGEAFQMLINLGRESRVPHYEDFVGDVMDKFGGTDKFISTWYDQINEAIGKKPGSATVLNQFSLLARLVIETSKNREDRDLARLSDKELQQEMVKATMQTILESEGAVREKLVQAFLPNLTDLLHGGVIDVEGTIVSDGAGAAPQEEGAAEALSPAPACGAVPSQSSP